MFKKNLSSSLISLIFALTLIGGCSADKETVSVAEPAAAEVPDLLGDYTSDPFSTIQEFGTPKMTPPAQAYFDQFTPDQDPAILCFESGLVRRIYGPLGTNIGIDENGNYLISDKVIHMDAGFPEEYAIENRGSWPISLFGHSIGRWEGDTLIVETRGLLSRDILRGEVPILPSELAIVTRELSLIDIDQRWARRGIAPEEGNPYLMEDGKTLSVKMTLDDPENLLEPWSVTKQYRQLSSDFGEISAGPPVNWAASEHAEGSGVPEEFLATYDGGCVLFPEYSEEGVEPTVDPSQY